MTELTYANYTDWRNGIDIVIPDIERFNFFLGQAIKKTHDFTFGRLYNANTYKKYKESVDNILFKLTEFLYIDAEENPSKRQKKSESIGRHSVVYEDNDKINAINDILMELKYHNGCYTGLTNRV